MNVQEWREQTNGMEKETRTVRKNMLRDHSSWHITHPRRVSHVRDHTVRVCVAIMSRLFALPWLSQRQDSSLTSSRVTTLPLSRGHLRSQQQ